MTLLDGQSELDTIVLRLVDKDIEIKTWDRFSLNQDFLTPTMGWTFVSSAETPFFNVFQAGDLVQILINEQIQCTGHIEKISTNQNREGGLVYAISGRDLLGRVVSGNLDPQIKITSNMNLIDFLSSILITFGIETIYNSDQFNINIVTGFDNNFKQTKTTQSAKQAVSKVVSADGKSSDIEFKTTPIVSVVNGARRDLKTLKLDQLKPHIGEGAYAMINRIISRLGYRLWMSADGNGVIIDKPDFTSSPNQKLIRKTEQSQHNNIVEGDSVLNIESQPSCIVATGNTTTDDDDVVTIKVIAINELAGLDENNQPIESVKNILTRYKAAKVLPLRKELYRFGNQQSPTFSINFIPSPMFIKDDESRNLTQLQCFARKQLSLKQKEFYVVNYTVEGMSYHGKPWAVNTMVEIDDDVLGIHKNMWVLSKTFSKDRSGGTYTQLTLINPYSLELGVES